MAQEKARSTRARKKPEGEAGAVPTVEKTTTRKARKPAAAAEPAAEAIAQLAYLLWERGEPGGPTEHWLRAESELRAA